MSRLPTPGSDNGTWGSILNSFLEVSHNADGSLKPSALQTAGAVQLDTSASDIQALGTQAAGSTGKAADAGHVHPHTGLVQGTGKVTVDTTAPSGPATDDLWYDSANDLLKRWNGAGWELAGAANPSLGYRPPDLVLKDKLFMGQAGHPFSYSGTGTTGNNNDTSDFVLGTEAITVTSNGAGNQAKISGTFSSVLDLTGKNLVVWVKLENYGNVLGGYPRLYLGDTGLTNAYYWKLAETQNQPWGLDGEWHRVTLPFGTASTVGSPSRASLAALTMQIYDNSSGQVTFHLGGLATMAEPAVAWPSGVVSLAFDDGFISQFTTAKPYMDRYGFRGTAYVIAETLWNHAAYPNYLDLASSQQLEWDSGWEIATHAYSAANHNAGYTSIGQEAALADAQAAKDYLRSNGFKSPELFAYPLGNYDSGILANTRRLFGAARTISSYGGYPDETVVPADLTRLRSMPVSTLNSLASVEAAVDRAYANKEWLILLFHDIQASASGNLQFSTANFQALMDYINTKGIPVRPVSEVLKPSASSSGTAIDSSASDIQSVGTQSAGSTGLAADAGHVHPLSDWLVTDQGLLAWSFDPIFAYTNTSVVAGTMYLTRVRLSASATISNIYAQVQNTAGSGLLGTYVGMYNSSGTLVASSADVSATFQSTGGKAAALSASYSAPAGLYWVAFLVASGTTMPKLGMNANTASSDINIGLSAAAGTLRYATGTTTGLSSLPASISPTSGMSGSPTAFWFALG
jgi:peptidoglycan/xylan/chitin deacetylase (PgdA/CDA1 family)